MKNIIIVGGQDEIFEDIDLEGFNVVSIQLQHKIGPSVTNKCARVIPVLDFTVEEIERATLLAMQEHPVSAMFGFAEFTILPTVEVAEKLEIPGMDKRISMLCRIKPNLRKHLELTDFHVPYLDCHSVAQAEEFATRFGYPVVVKETMGAGSANVTVCNNREQLKTATQKLLDHFDRALLEVYCGGKEFSVETLSLNGCHYVLGITEKFLIPNTVIEDSHIFPAPVDERTKERVDKATVQLLNVLDHTHGPMHIEFKVDGDKVRLIEVNNRGGGDFIWEMVFKSTGVNLIEKTIHSYFDKEMRLEDYQPEHSLAYISLYSETDPSALIPRLEEFARVLRFHYEHTEYSHEIKCSTDRPGFCLLSRSLTSGHIKDDMDKIKSIINNKNYEQTA
ncbi:ATP-grasp domain-containing protein [Winslowiella iniecta]|uniref:ATP-grasp domain-containing protein n=1 Tax=Winslowiella iniecta TaxID=1560201 RepID=UPI00069D26CB|nr:ATP-grasp domain-containing protein [Winslowiella iniecta]